MKSFLLIFKILGNLFLRLLPFPIHRDYRFAFLVHARDLSDVYRKLPFAKKIPQKMVEFWCKHSWPIVVSKVTGLKSLKDGKEVPGYIIGVPMTAHQMLENRKLALRRIIQACRLAEHLGVKIVGLGALTSSVSGGGLFLINKIRTGITTGHAFTVSSIVLSALDLIKLMELEKENISVAIVGAAGSIGSTCARLLAKKGIKKILLVDLERKNPNLRQLIRSLDKISSDIEILVSHKINDVKNSELIIAATNSPEALIRSEDLKSGAIVIDDAQPSDISQELLKEREDVFVIDGGVVNTPGIFSNFNLGLADKEDNYSCLGEILCLAASYWKGNYNIGRTNLERVREISKIAKSLGFKRSDFQNFSKKYTYQDIERIKTIIKK